MHDTPNPVERVRYTPPPEFYTEPCNDASEIVLLDLGSLGVEMGPGDTDAYIGALRSRFAECKEEQNFVDDYLNLLELGGWSGTHNRVLADYVVQFPGWSHPDPMPDSATGSGRPE